MSEETDLTIIENRKKFIELKEKNNIVQYASKDNDDTQAHFVLRTELNRYELIAVGISKKILHEKSYKAWIRSTLISDWRACKGFVMAIRHNTGVPTYYVELEKLANRWAKPDEQDHV